MNKERIYSQTLLTQMSGRDFVNLIRLTIREEVKNSIKQEFKMRKEVKHEKK